MSASATQDRRAPGGRAGIGGHHRAYQGRTEEWITPPSIIEAVGPFDLDPCAHPEQPFRTAEEMIAPPLDGLTRQWEGRVWLNPPYGPETARWMAKMARHGNGISLVFARTDTAWWHDSVAPAATAMLFLRGRLNFYRPNGERSAYNAGGPSVLIAYGAPAATRLLECESIDGWKVINTDSLRAPLCPSSLCGDPGSEACHAEAQSAQSEDVTA